MSKLSFLKLGSGLIVGLSVGVVVLAFNNPVSNPPTGTGAIGVGSGAPASSIYVDSSGNVGIGTTNLGALLDVQGAAQFGSGNVNLIDSTGKIAGISSTYFASLDGSTITGLNANNISAGTLPTARGGTGATANANTANGVVVLDASSKIPVGQFGALVDKSASYGAQQAVTDGFVEVWAYWDTIPGGISYIAKGFTDSASNPTTEIHRIAYLVDTSHEYYGMFWADSFTMAVKKNDYWKVVVTNAYGTVSLKVFWRPVGS